MVTKGAVPTAMHKKGSASVHAMHKKGSASVHAMHKKVGAESTHILTSVVRPMFCRC